MLNAQFARGGTTFAPFRAFDNYPPFPRGGGVKPTSVWPSCSFDPDVCATDTKETLAIVMPLGGEKPCCREVTPAALHTIYETGYDKLDDGPDDIASCDRRHER